jgi:hypothetical protein
LYVSSVILYPLEIAAVWQLFIRLNGLLSGIIRTISDACVALTYSPLPRCTLDCHTTFICPRCLEHVIDTSRILLSSPLRCGVCATPYHLEFASDFGPPFKTSAPIFRLHLPPPSLVDLSSFAAATIPLLFRKKRHVHAIIHDPYAGTDRRQ